MFFLLPIAAAIGEVSIERIELPDLVHDIDLPEEVIQSGFSRPHAPSKYTGQEIDDALASVAPGQPAVLESTAERRFSADEVVSVRTVIDPQGAHAGVDFSGELLDVESWTAIGEAEVPVERRVLRTRERRSRHHVFEEYVVDEPLNGGNPNVNVSIFSVPVPTDVVETETATLRCTPSTVPACIPAELVTAALSGAAPGDVVPLAKGYGVFRLETLLGEVDREVKAYDIQFGVDYIGDPNDYATWIAIGSADVLVNVILETEEGDGYLDQTLDYELVVPDSTGEILLNPEISEVLEVTDVTHAYSKTYTPVGSVPPEVAPADASTLEAKLTPGSAGLALHAIDEVIGETTAMLDSRFDAHGAVEDVDYSGDPEDPATWTALTTEDVVVDRFETRTVTTEHTASHEARMIYREASEDAGTTGEVFLVESDVIGRDVVEVKRCFVNVALDPGNLLEGVTDAQVQQALAWAEPGETVVVAQTRETVLVSTQTTPMDEIVDSNGWVLGIDFNGTAGDPQTWVAAGPSDIYIDIYQPEMRVRRYDEVVTNHTMVAPAVVPTPLIAEVFADFSGGSPFYGVGWDPPFGMEFGVETGTNLSGFELRKPVIQSIGERRWFARYPGSGQPSEFLRVVRR